MKGFRIAWSGLVAVVVLAVLVLAMPVLNAVWVIGIGVAAGVIFGGMYAAFQERHQVEQELTSAVGMQTELHTESARHREALDQLASGLDVMIFLTDVHTQVLFANGRAQQAFRFDSVEGQRILSLTLSSELEELIQAAIQSRQMQRSEITFQNPVERVGIAQAWGEPPHFQRIFVSIYDITDLRRLERVRRDFVANVSHELRTPMTTIRAMAETLQDDEDGDKELRERYLDKIIREVDRLTGITSDLLILSQVESQSLAKSTVNLAEILRNSVQFLMHKAEEKGIKLTYEGPTDLPAHVNESQFNQVVINLVDNALSYTDKGSVTVQAEKVGAQIEVRVMDTGIGIPSEHLPRIFERFYRVDKGRSRQRGGTGLGLAIVRHIVEAHGGRVSVVSILNEGTTFKVVLPAEL